MKKFSKLFVMILAVVSAAVALLCVGCDFRDPEPGPGPGQKPDDKPQTEVVDYAAAVQLDLASSSKKQEVTVRLYVDGDTTHFDPKLGSSVATCPSSDFAATFGFIKARYIAINTPESTGKIEEWGEAAKKFTRSKLETATSIIVESDDENWNLDSSGSNRYVVWIWYKTQGAESYRNLNIEILQEGLAFGSSVSNNRYGETALLALMQAQAQKKYIFSGEKDPDFPYGEATAVTLKELRCNIENYNNKKVRVEGVVTADVGNCVYIEDVDPLDETKSYGIQVFYAYETGKLLDILSIGNRVRVVGVVKYYETGETYQISDVTYKYLKPNDPANTQLVSENNEVPFTELSAKDIISGKRTVEFEKEVEDEDGNVTVEIESKEYDFGATVMNTSVTVKNLTIASVYTTNNGGNNDGALSITCTAEDGTRIVVRTEVLYDRSGKLITAAAFPVGKKIDVKGLVDKYNGTYQIKVYRADYITILN